MLFSSLLAPAVCLLSAAGALAAPSEMVRVRHRLAQAPTPVTKTQLADMQIHNAKTLICEAVATEFPPSHVYVADYRDLGSERVAKSAGMRVYSTSNLPVDNDVTRETFFCSGLADLRHIAFVAPTTAQEAEDIVLSIRNNENRLPAEDVEAVGVLRKRATKIRRQSTTNQAGCIVNPQCASTLTSNLLGTSSTTYNANGQITSVTCTTAALINCEFTAVNPTGSCVTGFTYSGSFLNAVLCGVLSVV